MKCLSCKHLTESHDPGGGKETGPGEGDSLACGLGKWYLGARQLQISDLRTAVEVAATCTDYAADPDLLHTGVRE